MDRVQVRPHRRFRTLGIARRNRFRDAAMLLVALGKTIGTLRVAALHAHARVGSHLAQ